MLKDYDLMFPNRDTITKRVKANKGVKKIHLLCLTFTALYIIRSTLGKKVSTLKVCREIANYQQKTPGISINTCKIERAKNTSCKI